MKYKISLIYDDNKIIDAVLNSDNIQILDSYKYWNKNKMINIINQLLEIQRLHNNNRYNRTVNSMLIEWYLHNIGYFIFYPTRLPILNRLKHTDCESK